MTLRPFLAALLMLSALAGNARPGKPVQKTPETEPKIQAAILLDVSNSMDRLIEQAKAQLWNMVSVMGRAKCQLKKPSVEIALYEYGKDSNDPSKGYIKQINPFISDLDVLSQNLFKLTTYGGSEYCGQVILTSLNELQWDPSPNSYKVIFISGNEDFLQGSVKYTDACDLARQKGVIVNTIYCGDRAQGISEHWNLGGECGNGSYTNINLNAREPDIPTPYDSTLVILNSNLNKTYLYYGAEGNTAFARQATMDQLNSSVGGSVAAKRAAVKADQRLYNNAGWDLIDKRSADTVRFRKELQEMDRKTLPDSLKNKSAEELEKIVTAKSNERAAIQKNIVETNTLREKFIAEEKRKRAGQTENTLESEVEKMIKEQAKRYNMVIEN